MATGCKARFSTTLSLLTVLAMGGTWFFLLGSPEAGPRRSSQAEPAAGQANLLPYRKVAPPRVLKEKYVNMRVTPYHDPKFYFEVAVPRSFKNQPVKVTREQLKNDSSTPVPMAEFKPKKDDVLIEARYVRVPKGVTLDRFMNVFAKESGFRFIERQRGTFEGRQVEDALLSIDSPSLGRTLTRLTVSRRGDLIFMVAGSCREEAYPRWKQAFAVAALSFSPTGK